MARLLPVHRHRVVDAQARWPATNAATSAGPDSTPVMNNQPPRRRPMSQPGDPSARRIRRRTRCLARPGRRSPARPTAPGSTPPTPRCLGPRVAHRAPAPRQRAPPRRGSTRHCAPAMPPPTMTTSAVGGGSAGHLDDRARTGGRADQAVRLRAGRMKPVDDADHEHRRRCTLPIVTGTRFADEARHGQVRIVGRGPQSMAAQNVSGASETLDRTMAYGDEVHVGDAVLEAGSHERRDRRHDGQDSVGRRAGAERTARLPGRPVRCTCMPRGDQPARNPGRPWRWRSPAPWPPTLPFPNVYWLADATMHDGRRECAYEVARGRRSTSSAADRRRADLACWPRPSRSGCCR